MQRMRSGLLALIALACVACATSVPPPDLYDEILACGSGSACHHGMPPPPPEQICPQPDSCDTVLWSPYF